MPADPGPGVRPERDTPARRREPSAKPQRVCRGADRAGVPERRAGAGHGLWSDRRPRARRHRPDHRTAARHRVWRDRRRRRLHHHQRPRRCRRETRAGRAAPRYHVERPRAFAGDLGEPDGRRARRRHGERHRPGAAQGGRGRPARAAAGGIRRHPAGRNRVRLREPRGTAQFRHDGRRQLGGAAARSRQPDDLHPDGRADQSGQQRRTAGERGR